MVLCVKQNNTKNNSFVDNLKTATNHIKLYTGANFSVKNKDQITELVNRKPEICMEAIFKTTQNFIYNPISKYDDILLSYGKNMHSQRFVYGAKDKDKGKGLIKDYVYNENVGVARDDKINELLKANGIQWKKVSEEHSKLHNINLGKNQKNNIKLMSNDGYYEAVYDYNGKLLTEDYDPINMGTFNFEGKYDTKSGKLRHFQFDIAPWVDFGTSEKNPSWRVERLGKLAGSGIEAGYNVQ